MSKYKKVFRWAGPVILPMVIAGIRYLFRRRKDNHESNQENDVITGHKVLDTIVDLGLSSVTRKMRGSRKSSW